MFKLETFACFSASPYPVFKGDDRSLYQEIDGESGRAAMVFDDLCDLLEMPRLEAQLMNYDFKIGRPNEMRDQQVSDVTADFVYLNGDEYCVREETTEYVVFKKPFGYCLTNDDWLSKYHNRQAFFKWAAIKHLIGMNGHRRENVFMHWGTLSRGKSDCVHGTRVLQDLLILGNICPSTKERLRTDYYNNTFESTFDMMDRVRPQEVNAILMRHGYPSSLDFIRDRINKFHNRVYKELDIPFVSHEAYLASLRKY